MQANDSDNCVKCRYEKSFTLSIVILSLVIISVFKVVDIPLYISQTIPTTHYRTDNRTAKKPVSLQASGE